MKQMTEQHLINAFGGESQANMRYMHSANQADKENFPNVARLLPIEAADSLIPESGTKKTSSNPHPKSRL